MPSLLDEELDLSVLSSLENFNEQDQDKKKEVKTDTLDLSVLEDTFSKEIQPLKTPEKKITSKFGKRKDPFGLGKKFHNGVDIPMKLGTPITSLGRGIVVNTGDSGSKDYGKFVVVDYGGGLQLTYGHLNKIGVEVGDKVTSEAFVGLSGSTGRSKSPHLHIKAMLNGKAVNPEDYFGSIHDVALGVLSNDDVVENSKLDLSILENLDEEEIKKEEEKEVLDLSSIDTLGDLTVKPIEEVPYIDNSGLAETIARGSASYYQPKTSVKSPDEFVGNPIRTSINILHDLNRPNLTGIGLKPSENQVVDAWLGALDPSYAQLNSEYRNKTGKNLVLLDANRAATYKGNSKWEIAGRLTYGAKELINSYIEGRKKGGVDAGIEAVYFKNQQLDRQAKIVGEEISKAQATNQERLNKAHPYIRLWAGFESGVIQSGRMDAQLFHNLRMLPEAIYTLYRYGGDSDQYQQLIERDREIQEKLFSYQGDIPQSENISGKIAAGVGTGVASFPQYALAGSLGAGVLPTMVYVENLHRGSRNAALTALPMALMVGATRGFEQFANAGTSLYVTKTAKDGTQFIERTQIGRGLGSVAPFKRIKGELSLNQEANSAFLASNPVSIRALSGLERQLIMRGTNAFQGGGTSLIEGESAQDVAANFIVGLTFPVGKQARGSFEEGKFGLIPYIPEAKPVSPAAKQLKAAPSVVVESEGQTLYLPLDTAALNLLDLKRSLKDLSHSDKGAGLKENVNRQIAIQRVIAVLEKQISPETLKYFEDNEALIRSALKSNYEATKAREEYLGAKEQTQEVKTPDEVKENPNININESPIDRLRNNLNNSNRETIKNNPQLANEVAKDVFGNIGEQNRWETPDRILFVTERAVNQASKLKEFFKSEKGELDIKATIELTRIAAFHLEDFYHRRIEPSITELANRFKLTLGDLVNNFNDKDFQTLFEKGKEYLDSNVADPFFSRMKQDAVEKLPNRFNIEQARNILGQHKDEFEWTSGLNEFLESNKGRKISKQELVDFIQKNQVRVDESIGIERQKITDAQQEINRKLSALHTDRNLLNAEDWKEAREIDRQIRELHDESKRIGEQSTTRFSLTAYQGEKLELPGAKNSKEVKLITPMNPAIPAGMRYEIFDPKDGKVIGYARDSIEAQQKTEGTPYDYSDAQMSYYESAHWSESNVVAHYRSNDRISTDNKRIYFGEEFQSDWNHDIREYGPKRTTKEAQEYAENNVEEFVEYGKTFYRIKPLGNESIVGNVSSTKEGAIENFVMAKSGMGTERNPFMQHNWKELVLKRFLRDAAIAKDENGNYKYDAIGWTTARQQLERYGGILEGKDFEWRKNSDGTYSFGLKTDVQAGHLYVHELQNISLERFAELTTKEAADFVRQQEANWIDDMRGIVPRPSGQFSLSETVELRSREGTYADYDVAYKNILSKIGKRFGAKYSEREVPTNEKYLQNYLEDNGYDFAEWQLAYAKFEPWAEKLFNDFHSDNLNTRNKEKIHSLEITPSMRQSLEKEGLPLYGTGGSEALKYPEAGARNRIITADAFNSARENLVNKLSQDQQTKGTILNSGLNPDAFIDQVRLLYSGIKDLAEFTHALVEKYGEPLRQYAEDFYWAIRDKAAEFNEKLNISIDKWQTNLNKVADDPAWQIRNTDKGERGSFSLRKKTNIPEVEEYYNDISKHQKYIAADYRAWLRGVALSQLSTQFGKVYDTMRSLQRVVASYETTTLNKFHQAKTVIKLKLDKPVAEALYQGNEWINPATGKHEGKVWTDAELISNFNFDSQQIDAYRNMREAVDNVLNLRLGGKLYAVRDKANKLNAKLLTAVPGSAEEINIKTQLLDLADAQTKMIKYYDDLKKSGYITLQRKGKVAAFIEDPSYPVGDPKRKIYNQFNSEKDARAWLVKQKNALGIPVSTKAGSIYDIVNLKDIALKEKLTPSQFEDLVDRSGAHTNDPEIEKIRAEVYSKFPSFTYQLEREFIRGYDRDLQTAINSTVNQLELYASSFYSKVGKEEGMKQLEATGIEKTDPNLYRLASSFINDETTHKGLNWLERGAVLSRRFTYLWQLGFDINQLYLNAVAQPITNTYGYFYRVTDPNGSGKQLTGLEPEQYFLRAGELAAQALKSRQAEGIVGKSIKTLSKVVPGNVLTEFNDIVTRLTNERVLSPEFTKTYIEAETGTGKASKLEHWASTFMRNGEKVTRTHAAAEAYLVGKEKFGLAGEQLVDFMVKAVDATQSNPTRGENPFVVRQLGEGGKLFYQFIAFNQMWWENLALGTILDKSGSSKTRKSLFAARELAPLAIMGGMAGMPLAAFAGTMYTLITGKDPKKEMDKYLGDDTLIEQLVRYGITTSAALSQKLTPSAPILDSLGRILTADVEGVETAAGNIPAIATGNQIFKATKQIVSGELKRGLTEILPRSLKGPARAVYVNQEGYKAGNKTLMSRGKVGALETAGQIINIVPTKVIEKYEENRTKKLRKISKKLKRAL
jgi:murein DD-endopeptidase MepM/ murein hydrolase activator NlpD